MSIIIVAEDDFIMSEYLSGILSRERVFGHCCGECGRRYRDV